MISFDRKGARGAVSLLCLFLLALPARSAELAVAAAADLKFAFDELVGAFHAAQSTVSVRVTYGSSGNFFAQLQHHAPFDLYFSADIRYPRQLAESGYALDGDVFLYAVGRIVVWTPHASQVDVEGLGIQSLLAPPVRKIAIANPRHAPYGVAAVAAMRSLGVYDAAEPRLVYGENVAQTAQFAQSGAADVGIIALSLALAPQLRDRGSYWEIPSDAYPRMEQGGLIAKGTKEPQAARAFRDFVLSQRGRAVLERFGFYLPAEGAGDKSSQYRIDALSHPKLGERACPAWLEYFSTRSNSTLLDLTISSKRKRGTPASRRLFRASRPEASTQNDFGRDAQNGTRDACAPHLTK